MMPASSSCPLTLTHKLLCQLHGFQLVMDVEGSTLSPSPLPVFPEEFIHVYFYISVVRITHHISVMPITSMPHRHTHACNSCLFPMLHTLVYRHLNWTPTEADLPVRGPLSCTFKKSMADLRRTSCMFLNVVSKWMHWNHRAHLPLLNTFYRCIVFSFKILSAYSSVMYMWVHLLRWLTY